jgi:hypothetical protein
MWAALRAWRRRISEQGPPNLRMIPATLAGSGGEETWQVLEGIGVLRE